MKKPLTVLLTPLAVAAALSLALPAAAGSWAEPSATATATATEAQGIPGATAGAREASKPASTQDIIENCESHGGTIKYVGPTVVCIPAQTPKDPNPPAHTPCWWGTPACGGAPNKQVIINFTADPPTVDYNGASQLSWTTQNADECALWGGTFGASPGENVAVNGSEGTGALTTDTTYTLQCSNSKDTRQKSLTVQVNPKKPPEEDYFRADHTNQVRIRVCTYVNGKARCRNKQARPPNAPVISWHFTHATQCTVSYDMEQTRGHGGASDSGTIATGSGGVSGTWAVPTFSIPWPHEGESKAYRWRVSAACDGPGGHTDFHGPSVVLSMSVKSLH
jgi:hypothetical protein